ncbi:hypothetical protein Hte_010256 [Hypoxylon texense]
MNPRGNTPIRLAILECDYAPPGIEAKHHSYCGVLTYMLERACASLDPPQPLESLLAISAYDVIAHPDRYPDLESIDAIMISGSRYSVLDSDEWITRLVQYTKRVLEDGRIRVVGICFGHQIVGLALGAQIKHDAGWELGVVEHELTDEGKKVFGTEKMSIQQMHRDSISSYPASVTPLAHTPACGTQAMYIPKRMISVQGHPEFTEEMVREILDMFKEHGAVSNEVYDDSMRRVGDKEDGVEVAKVFLRFMME